MKLRTAILVTTTLAAFCAHHTALGQDAARRKVIRNPVEYNAYMAAANIKEAGRRGEALEAFARNYPDSVARIDAMEHAMAAYQQAGNYGRLEAVANSILGQAPGNLRALAVITALERKKAGKGDGAAAQASCNTVQRAMQFSQIWDPPANADDPQSERVHRQMAAVFYGAAGFCDLQARDYSSARLHYMKALSADPERPLDMYQLGMAEVEAAKVDLTGLWHLAKAINLAQAQESPELKQEIETYAAAKYRKYMCSNDGWNNLVAETATEAAPPNGFDAKLVSGGTTLVERAFQQNDSTAPCLANLEDLLSLRDTSPDNRKLADRVWQIVQEKQKAADGKLTLKVKVLSATPQVIHAAIAERNQTLNREDFAATLERSTGRPPAAGSVIEVTGVMDSYTPNPFIFTMTQASIPGAVPAVAPLSEADIEKLLRGGVTPKRVTELVKQKGVSFTMDDAAENRLRKSGATDELLLAIATRKQ